MDSVKQSAALCLLRLYKASPDLVPMGEWTARVVHLLNDQHMVRPLPARPTLPSAPTWMPRAPTSAPIPTWVPRSSSVSRHPSLSQTLQRFPASVSDPQGFPQHPVPTQPAQRHCPLFPPPTCLSLKAPEL